MPNPTKFVFNPIESSFDTITNTDAEGLTFNAPIISGTVPTSPVTGQTWMTDTLNVKLANSTLQVGEEMYILAINLTGSTIGNGSLVYMSGAFGTDYQQITKAQANSATAHRAIGMTTASVGNGAATNVTSYGLVHDLNTSVDSEGNALSAGDTLYLSATVAGGWTKIAPLDSYYVVEIGYVVSVNASTGTIFIEIKHDESRDLALVTKEPTGFDTPDTVTITYDSTARTVTVGGTFNVYWRGTRVTTITPGYVSPAHSSTLDTGYYLYYNGASVVWSTSAWTFDMVQIAYVWYGTVDKFALRECHGTMDWNSHQEFHRVIGTYRSSGGTLSGYTLASTTAANKRPDVSSCTINDEDLPTVNAALTSKLYTKIYLSGTTASPVMNFTVETAEIVPMNTGINIPAYNLATGGNWTQAAMTNNTYSAVWLIAVPASASVTGQKYRYLWMQGQLLTASLATQQALTPADLTLGDLGTKIPEYIFIAKLIIQYVAGGTNNWNIVQVDNLTGNRFIQSSSSASVYLSSVAHDSSMTGDGSVANPLANTYTPAVSGNWATPPTAPNGALDYVAASGVAKAQVKNTALRGPTSGSDALPTFRTTVGEDLAAAATVPTAGRVLTAQGAGVIPQWVDPSFTQAAMTQAFTPTLTASSGTAPSNYTATGHWFAIGDQVFAIAEITYTGAGTSDAGILRISNPGAYTHSNTSTCIGQGEALDSSTGVTTSLVVRATAADAFVTMGAVDENADVSYQIPQTWASGDKIRIQWNFKAVQLSSYLTLYSNPMDAIGQLIYGGASGVPTKLAAGTAGYLLQSNGAAAPTWVQAFPAIVAVTSGGALDLSLYRNAIYMCSNASDITIDLSTIAAGVRDGSIYTFKNIGNKSVTLNPNSTELIDNSSTSYLLNPLESVTLAVYSSIFRIV